MDPFNATAGPHRAAGLGSRGRKPGAAGGGPGPATGAAGSLFSRAGHRAEVGPAGDPGAGGMGGRRSGAAGRRARRIAVAPPAIEPHAECRRIIVNGFLVPATPGRLPARESVDETTKDRRQPVPGSGHAGLGRQECVGILQSPLTAQNDGPSSHRGRQSRSTIRSRDRCTPDRRGLGPRPGPGCGACWPMSGMYSAETGRGGVGGGMRADRGIARVGGLRNSAPKICSASARPSSSARRGGVALPACRICSR